MISLLAFVFVLGVLVILHEAGHFAMARVLGAPVEVFSVGFGRRIWGFRRGGTDYRISLIPLGGYVRIVGLGPDESDVIGESSASTVLLARWKRALILLAGPVTNVLAAVAFVAIALASGVETPAYHQQPPVVGWVEPGSPAEEAGVRVGDLVTALDGKPVAVWRDLEIAALTNSRDPVVVTVDRDGSPTEVTVGRVEDDQQGFGFRGLEPHLEAVVVPMTGSPAAVAGIQSGDRIVAVDDSPVSQYHDLPLLIGPTLDKEDPDKKVTIDIVVVRDGHKLNFRVTPRDVDGVAKIGVGPQFETTFQRLAPTTALRTASEECWRMTLETFHVIGRLITGRASLKQVTGPIGIAQISGEAARSGVQTLIWLMGVISLQLGIFNLLPIPILDGGHLTIIGFEVAIRRDLSIRIKERILEVGFYLLILLMVVVFFNDIVSRVLPGIRQLISSG